MNKGLEIPRVYHSIWEKELSQGALEGSYIDYCWGKKENLLSVVVEVNDYFPEYYVYNVSTEKKELINIDAFLDIYGLTMDEFYRTSRIAMTRYMESMKNSYIAGTGRDEDYYSTLLDRTLDEDNIKRSIPYINSEGELCIIAYFDTPVDWCWHMINMEGESEGFLECQVDHSMDTVDNKTVLSHEMEDENQSHISITEDEAYQIACNFWSYIPGESDEETGFELFVTPPTISSNVISGRSYYSVRLQWYVDDADYPHMSTVDWVYIDTETGECYHDIPQDNDSSGATSALSSMQNASTSSYVLPQSDSEYITERNIYGMSAWELKIARNEIFARHGRRFKDLELQAYFDNCSWYSGTVSPDNFNDSVLNEYERTNIKIIQNYEQRMGYIQ